MLSPVVPTKNLFSLLLAILSEEIMKIEPPRMLYRDCVLGTFLTTCFDEGAENVWFYHPPSPPRSTCTLTMRKGKPREQTERKWRIISPIKTHLHSFLRILEKQQQNKNRKTTVNALWQLQTSTPKSSEFRRLRNLGFANPSMRKPVSKNAGLQQNLSKK